MAGYKVGWSTEIDRTSQCLDFRGGLYGGSVFIAAVSGVDIIAFRFRHPRLDWIDADFVSGVCWVENDDPDVRLEPELLEVFKPRLGHLDYWDDLVLEFCTEVGWTTLKSA